MAHDVSVSNSDLDRTDARELIDSVMMDESNPLDGLVPIVVGVTGHLDLDDQAVPKLEQAVRNVLADIKTKHPHQPMVLLTPLARGADTLVARVARSFGAQLVVTLPLRRDEYEKDFDEDALVAFGDLIDDPRVARRIELPPIRDSEPPLDAQSRRELQYALAGAYVARHCDILIALWDGVWTDKVGGTSQIVHFRRAGSFNLAPDLLDHLAAVPEPFQVGASLLDPPAVGPLYHVVTPRRNQPAPEGALTHRYLLPYAHGSAVHEPSPQLMDRIREFNRDALALHRSQPEAIERSARQLYPDASRTDDRRAGGELPTGLAALCKCFAVADALSLNYQRALHRVQLALFATIFVGAVAFAFFADGFQNDQFGSRALIGAYVAVFALADAVFVYVMVRRWQDKHQDYRAVAEGLRVQFYWRLAGLEHFASDHYVRKQRDELTWIPHAVRACSIAAPRLATTELGLIRRLWIAGQADYYDAACTRAQDSLRWRHAGSGSLAISLLLGLLILQTHSGGSSLLLAVLIFASAILLAHAAAWLLGRMGSDHATANHRGRTRDVMAGVAGAALAGAVGLLLYQVPDWLRDQPGWTPTEQSEWLLIALGLTAVAGALLHGYAEIQAFAEHARHYGRLAELFRRANDRLRGLLDGGHTARARALVMELGKEALTDHGDWVMLHRERPIELPEAGG